MEIAPGGIRRGSARPLNPPPSSNTGRPSLLRADGGIQITVHEPAAMPHRKHRQHLAQQQQNLIRTEPP